MQTTFTADDWIQALGLEAHPEGGFFKEVYRASECINASALPQRYDTERSFSTSIYYLLKAGQFSALHRLNSDELWHFYAGTGLTLSALQEDGQLTQTKLGSRIQEGETLQSVVPYGTWFGAHVPDPNGFALVGCTVAPGFDFVDLEFGKRTDLLAQFPQHKTVIEKLALP